MHTVTSSGTVLYPATGAYLPVRQYAAAYTLSQRSEQFKNVQIKKTKTCPIVRVDPQFKATELN